MVLAFIDHQGVELLVDLIDFCLATGHEAALGVNVAEGTLALLAPLFFFIYDFIGGFGLNLVLDVHVVDEVEKHGKVLKSHALHQRLLFWLLVLLGTVRLQVTFIVQILKVL